MRKKLIARDARYFLFFIVLLGLIWGCTSPDKPKEIRAEDALKLLPSCPPISFDDLQLSRPALESSLAYYKGTKTETFRFGKNRFSKEQLQDALLEFSKLAPSLQSNSKQNQQETDSLAHTINEKFSCFAATSPILATGYYVPTLRGSLQKSEQYPYPIYRAPPDLVDVTLSADIKRTLDPKVPVINRGRLTAAKFSFLIFPDKRSIEIMCLRENNSRLHIPTIRLHFSFFISRVGGIGTSQWEKLLLAYADKNGQPYRAIGKTLLEKGLVQPGVTMQSIKDALKKNPEIQNEILDSNPSYVFSI